jgi:two-component system, LytTR family, sensor kinase
MRELIGFDDRLMILIGWPLSSMMISLLLFHEYYVALDWGFLSTCIPMSFVYTGLFWYALRTGYTHIRNYYPASDQLYLRLLIITPIFFIIFFVINSTLDAIFKELLPSHISRPNFIPEFIGAFMLSGFVLMIYEVMGYHYQLQKTIVERDLLERQNIESQLEGLRNQVNPHFLFNTLNTLAYLIPEDSEKAVRFVHQLSRVYRYVLDSRDTKLIALKEEMSFLESYVFLQKERFGNSLHVHLGELPDPNKTAIVPLTLQLLFENAIKHNIVSTEKPLHIDVYTENNRIIVKNNLQAKQQRMTSTGVGLQNIKDRYQLLSQKTVEVFVTPNSFTVAFPVLEL